MSSPLILGLDMSNGETMDRIWTTITNKDALAINNAWVGHPGTLVKSYPATGDVSLTVDQVGALSLLFPLLSFPLLFLESQKTVLGSESEFYHCSLQYCVL